MKLDHKEALEEFEHNWQGDASNRRDALDDLKSMSGIGQWDNAELARREADNRPALTINLQPQFVRQVANDIKQMQPSVDTIPVDDQTDPAMSEIFDGLIRQIEYQSGASHAYGHGGAMAVACGIGHWRVTTDHVRDSVFDQEIRVERIMDPLAVVWDSAAVEIDRADARNCYVTASIPKHEFERRFKKAKREGADFPDAHDSYSTPTYWHEGDTVRIAERFYLEPYKRHLIMTVDGTTHDLTGMKDFEAVNLIHAHGGPHRFENGEVAQREFEDFRVKHVLMDGHDFLEDPQDWAGRFIPIVPCLGDEVAFDGKVVRSGIVRWTKDSQRAYNYWRSAAMEVIAQTPKAPFLLTAEQVAGWEDLWRGANNSNLPFLIYNADPENPQAKPQRERPADPPAALWQEANIARDEMKGVTGIYDASLGAQSNETSGRAIIARERQGDVGNFNFIDNFNAAIRRTGQIFVDLIPKIYDTDRVVRLIGKDDTEMFTRVNSEPVRGLKINDLSAARFDVRVKTGPSYTTARIEAREQMVEMLRANPALWNVIGDLVFKNSDFEGAEEIAERLKRMMPPEVLGEEAEQQPPDPMQLIAQRLGLMREEVELALEQAKVEKTEAETDKIKSETAGNLTEIGATAAQVL